MISVENAKKIFKQNFIGPDELIKLDKYLKFKIPKTIPDINIDINKIDPSKYILIFGCNQLLNLSSVDIRFFIKNFGFEYNSNNICFYNQDWYFKEEFIDNSLDDNWYLIGKDIIEETRGLEPAKKSATKLPSAILCVYTFFIWWLINNELLWANDFIWCSDKDKYGDRIYVGKYIDNDKVERSGFSIHRHLTIKQNYGSIKYI